MVTHPPLAKGETFLGNTNTGMPPYLRNLPGFKLRRPAYSINGEILEDEYQAVIALSPEAAETYNSVMERRLSEIRKGTSIYG